MTSQCPTCGLDGRQLTIDYPTLTYFHCDHCHTSWSVYVDKPDTPRKVIHPQVEPRKTDGC